MFIFCEARCVCVKNSNFLGAKEVEVLLKKLTYDVLSQNLLNRILIYFSYKVRCDCIPGSFFCFYLGSYIFPLIIPDPDPDPNPFVSGQ